ncbi:DUF1289 domain-containing protein [Methylomonas sp. HW2-6]|uniref:DUF1289 domain-containing protein n=1 Tax=Methylomonas sp. HW2-6 TaxID=3376687 RepID=UPI0040418A3A
MTDDSFVRSPCIRNCCLDDNDICLGCFRSLDEIRSWSSSDNPTREQILRRAEQRRQSYPQASFFRPKDR